mmetsp:Transcript_50050/g.116804  ORF Transcript_50050/g.116804 Transcript_50050/m.116804 type:complete len:246 (+) Transcript_50050:159-896(+)
MGRGELHLLAILFEHSLVLSLVLPERATQNFDLATELFQHRLATFLLACGALSMKKGCLAPEFAADFSQLLLHGLALIRQPEPVCLQFHIQLLLLIHLHFGFLEALLDFWPDSALGALRFPLHLRCVLQTFTDPLQLVQLLPPLRKEVVELHWILVSGVIRVGNVRVPIPRLQLLSHPLDLAPEPICLLQRLLQLALTLCAAWVRGPWRWRLRRVAMQKQARPLHQLLDLRPQPGCFGLVPLSRL